jgi:hypothetical protein
MCSWLKNITLEDEPKDTMADILMKFMRVESLMKSLILVAVSDVAVIVVDYEKELHYKQSIFIQVPKFS